MKNRKETLKPALFSLAFSAILLSLFACGPSNDSSALLSDSNADILNRSLASGYDSARNLKFAACIDPAKYVYSGSNSSILSYIRDYNYDQLLDEVSMGIFAKLNLFGLIKAKASGDITSEMATTDDSSAFLYKIDIVGKSAVLKNPTLNANGLSAYLRHDPLAFRKTCGDQYVEQVQLGAQMFLGVKYFFTSKEDKEKLKVQMKVSLFWGLIKFTKTWTKEEKSLLKNVRVNVDAYQVGGDPDKLEAIKKTLERTSCAGDDMVKCGEALDKLLDYAANVFPKQLNGMNISSQPNVGPAVIAITTVPYKNQPVYDKPNGTPVTINVDADTTVKGTFGDALNRLTRLRTLLNTELSRRKTLLQFKLSSTERVTVEVGVRDVQSLLDAVKSLFDRTCVPAKKDNGLMESCIAKVGELESKGSRTLAPIALPSRF